ncbi:hypothetical protein GCM10027456_57160 [Kineosporia babensis]
MTSSLTWLRDKDLYLRGWIYLGEGRRHCQQIRATQADLSEHPSSSGHVGESRASSSLARKVCTAAGWVQSQIEA